MTAYPSEKGLAVQDLWHCRITSYKLKESGLVVHVLPARPATHGEAAAAELRSSAAEVVAACEGRMAGFATVAFLEDGNAVTSVMIGDRLPFSRAFLPTLAADALRRHVWLKDVDTSLGR